MSMRYPSTWRASAGPVALTTVALLGLALVLCMVHTGCDEAGMDGMDMVHGGCPAALVVSLFTAGVVFASVNWWLLPGLAVSPYAVSLHLPDPPPKSSALL